MRTPRTTASLTTRATRSCKGKEEAAAKKKQGGYIASVGVGIKSKKGVVRSRAEKPWQRRAKD